LRPSRRRRGPRCEGGGKVFQEALRVSCPVLALGIM
jgi:hypothetical protein